MTGVGLLVFGLVNLFWYVPVSLGIALKNRPFPFEHLKNVEPYRGGIHGEVGHWPIHEAINDPYWLIWSLSLYAGIAVLSFIGVKSLRQKTVS